jgi:hypothetical protein
MASFTISVAPWPVGQVVGAYPIENWSDPLRAPSGAATASGTVTSTNTVLFDGLDDNRRYVAYALGQGVRFATSATGLQASVAVPDRERIKALEDAVVPGAQSGTLIENPVSGWPDRPDTTGSVLWIGWTDPTALMAEYDCFIGVPDPS